MQRFWAQSFPDPGRRRIKWRPADRGGDETKTPLHPVPTHHTLPYTPHARDIHAPHSTSSLVACLQSRPPSPHRSPSRASAVGSGRVSGSKSNCHLPPVEDGNIKSDSDTIFKITTHHRCGGGRLGRCACSSPPTIVPQFPVRVCKVERFRLAKQKRLTSHHR